jgi:coniferyl-alcohol glucosyltransferase
MALKSPSLLLPLSPQPQNPNFSKKTTNSYSLNILLLPYKDFTSLLDPSANIAVIMRESLPSLRLAITAMKILPKVLIVDIFGTEAFEIAQQFGMRKYFFDTCNTRLLALITYFPTIDKEEEYNHINKQQPLQLPGCEPVRFEDTFEPYCNPNDRMYVVSLRIGVEIPMVDGILVNTWQDLEPITLGALRDDEIWRQVIKVPIYPIGPLVKLRRVEQQFPRGNKVLEWLDMQPRESVIYLSFGSGGTLSKNQIAELAWGLELSQQRFIWGVRPPIDNDAHGSYFKNTHDEIIFTCLSPEGVRDLSPGPTRWECWSLRGPHKR